MIIVGLGNPGKKYENTHHNVGFMAIDKIAEVLNVKFNKKGCAAEYGFTSFNGEQIVLAKPQTYMNLSGEAVKSLMSHFKEDADNVLIIFDDIEIPLGAIRVRKDGSGGTHNGMKNIILEVGTKEIPRIRIGLGVDKTIDLKDYVLSPISKADMEIVSQSIDKINDALVDYVKDKDIEKLMQKCNQKQ